MDFATVIFNFRVSHELSQESAAKILGTTQSDVSEYEKGKRKPTKMKRCVFENKIKEYEEKERSNKNV